ncbi:hypothetical protein PUNSTDRAFT_45936 [Punctularia strigosozonata HHB-11173 SS5]|uniref:uncharacterized protein n=1 Tax=Punctularia strigosozonata (strain HHB-11173) TaxID=741275 RepID=UPI00044167B0|nr:uncharacterized protein PUNSTDRAFT_45936 [Punctularia strigosozonata HHB-11173 SS5]EIN06425.1 hypothetical protein PUNSTDRAFT_45936 [Punctularia strigosozonata HHB-11173 SS5]
MPRMVKLQRKKDSYGDIDPNTIHMDRSYPAYPMSPPGFRAIASRSSGSDIAHAVCTFPLSGQYGPGSRILYYALILVCIFAQKSEWLRSASVAAALLLPAIASFHAIVLAAFSHRGFVDLDAFGALQFIALGVLVAPTSFILVPSRGMTPGAAILVSLACCIPTFISLATMWNKILSENAVLLGIRKAPEPTPNPLVRGQQRTEQRISGYLRFGLELMERAVFAVFFIIIVILGELNFWSPQMRSGVEPMAAVGQWSPIVGAVLTALGSACTELLGKQPVPPPLEMGQPIPAIVVQNSDGIPHNLSSQSLSASGRDPGGRRRLAGHIKRLAIWFGTPTERHYGEDGFGDLESRRYPLVPGEELRNPNLGAQREWYERRASSSRSSIQNADRHGGHPMSHATTVQGEASSDTLGTRSQHASSAHLGPPMPLTARTRSTTTEPYESKISTFMTGLRQRGGSKIDTIPE